MLDRDVQQLRVDFERFFNGALPFPPEELRGRVQAQIRTLRGLSNGATAVDNFRLGDLEARFNSYNELFNRRLRDTEEGRHPAARHAPPPAPRRSRSGAGDRLRRPRRPRGGRGALPGSRLRSGGCPPFRSRQLPDLSQRGRWPPSGRRRAARRCSSGWPPRMARSSSRPARSQPARAPRRRIIRAQKEFVDPRLSPSPP